MRDITQAQFDAQIIKHGFRPPISDFPHLRGYYKLPEPYSNISVCSLNGGNTRRGQLAYLLTQLRAEVSKRENK